MLPLPVTAVTTALAAILLVALSFHVSFGRVRTGIDAGDGGDEALRRRVRAQGNFTEYAPVGLLLLALLELRGNGVVLLWSFASALLLGRVLHALGMLGGSTPARATGMLLTHGALLGGAGLLLLG